MGKLIKTLEAMQWELNRIARHLQEIEERGRYYRPEITVNGKKMYLCDPEKNTICKYDKYCKKGQCYTSHEEFALKR